MVLVSRFDWRNWAWLKWPSCVLSSGSFHWTIDPWTEDFFTEQEPRKIFTDTPAFYRPTFYQWTWNNATRNRLEASFSTTLILLSDGRFNTRKTPFQFLMHPFSHLELESYRLLSVYKLDAIQLLGESGKQKQLVYELTYTHPYIDTIFYYFMQRKVNVCQLKSCFEMNR